MLTPPPYSVPLHKVCPLRHKADYDLAKTPVKLKELELELQSYPDSCIAQELICGFKFGFPLHYTGPLFQNIHWVSSSSLQLFTDSSAKYGNGFGAYFDGNWAYGQWPEFWFNHDYTNDITVLEFFPILVTVHIWGKQLQHKKTAINQFRKFRAMAALGDLWPAPLDHIMLFIAYLSRQSRTASTISSYMAALSFIHKINNWSDPSHTFLVTKALEGMKRLRPQKDCRAPITIEFLQKIYCELPNVCLSYYEVLLFRSAYTLAFFGLFRVGELVFTTNSMANRPLLYSDINFSTSQGRSMLTVQLRFSKTDQRGKSCRVHLAELRNNPICPVSNVREFLRKRSSLHPQLRVAEYGGQSIHDYKRGRASPLVGTFGKDLDKVYQNQVPGTDAKKQTSSKIVHNPTSLTREYASAMAAFAVHCLPREMAGKMPET
ncbi:hypothetical protein KUTeg_021845 [Tegillarca granosa]|uniref:Uncharacterized protein n=1 Tax=Tegillarca granosa TaxID=220873 RepID=A0ABQ9E953_TEGGR|nr:hypothetical protein KUTeg_021845 [Tegillarca granosa]